MVLLFFRIFSIMTDILLHSVKPTFKALCLVAFSERSLNCVGSNAKTLIIPLLSYYCSRIPNLTFYSIISRTVYIYFLAPQLNLDELPAFIWIWVCVIGDHLNIYCTFISFLQCLRMGQTCDIVISFHRCILVSLIRVENWEKLSYGNVHDLIPFLCRYWFLKPLVRL